MQRPVHDCGNLGSRFFLHAGDQVAVDVERERNRRMAEPLRHDLRMDTRRHRRRRGVCRRSCRRILGRPAAATVRLKRWLMRCGSSGAPSSRTKTYPGSIQISASRVRSASWC